MSADLLFAVLLAAAQLCPTTLDVSEADVHRAATRARADLDDEASIAEAAGLVCQKGARRVGKRLLLTAKQYRGH